MASTPDFIESILEQLSDVGEIRARKAFGDYLIYINDKCILTVCDNVIYVKKLDCLSELMQNAEVGSPYDGAKEHYILDLDNLEFAKKIVRLATDATPLPKPKKKKTS